MQKSVHNYSILYKLTYSQINKQRKNLCQNYIIFI